MGTFITIKNSLNNSFPALMHKNFRYFWIGQWVSLIGTWMQSIGQGWLVSKSALLLGFVGVAQFTPFLLFSLFAGVFIEKYSKKKILIFTQTASMLLAFILAFLVWSGYFRDWHIFILATALGVVNTIDMPTRQSFIIELVGREDLMNAIALNSSIFNAARIIGPAVAGLLMGYMGVAFCFFANGISYIAVIFGLFRIQTPPFIKKKSSKGSVLKDIREGLAFITKSKVLYRTLTLVAVMGIFAVNFNVLVPLFTKGVLHQKETGFGLLMSSMGVGSLTGAVILAAKSKARLLNGSILIGGSIIVAFALIATGFTRVYVMTALLLAFTGFFSTTFFSLANSALQLNASDKFRGRVTSVYTLVNAGTTPFGSIFAGCVANAYGPGMGFIISGIVILVFVSIIMIVRGRDANEEELMEI